MKLFKNPFNLIPVGIGIFLVGLASYLVHNAETAPMTRFADCPTWLSVDGERVNSNVFGVDADDDGLAPKPSDPFHLFEYGTYICVISSRPVSGYVLIKSEAEIGLDDDDTVANKARLCMAPEFPLMSYPWQLWVSDKTSHPFGSDDPNLTTPLASGVGTLCGEFTLRPGHDLSLNGSFDLDGDGRFGEPYADGDGVWAYMPDANNVSAVTIDGMSVKHMVTNQLWSNGSDGIYRIPAK